MVSLYTCTSRSLPPAYKFCLSHEVVVFSVYRFWFPSAGARRRWICFCLFLPIFLSFQRTIECVYRACRIQYHDMALCCPFCVLHNNVGSPCRSFVTAELISLYERSISTNTQEHWMCWMSTGRRGGLTTNTYHTLRTYTPCVRAGSSS